MSPAPFLPLMIGPLGMQEMLIILMVALIVFGPRKLPQIGKTLGKSLAEFRRTSTELRSTLEREVQMEEFRAARTEISDIGKDVSGGLDPAAGAGPRGEGNPGSGPAGGTPAGDAGAAPGGDPPDTGSVASASATTSGAGGDAADTPDPAADAGDPGPESREDTGK